MSEIEFTPQEKESMVKKLRQYLTENLDQEISRFDAEFLLDFISKEIGVYFYNRGLFDAQAILKKRLDDLTEAIYELEKPTGSSR